MLKALELFGFKSFADKTRFEFPPGITVVVGPNGSGKSNIVDAIKWVLGEQSAKSLRGKEMADVIFKGSGSASGGRRMMNTAEATIIFENADGRLPVDAPEVHVTRRVYRSGEGEYLINNQPCRLRDIRDMFRGTGVGTDAYSLIEQGKVDRLLQASPRDRRAIFEEAAGISRFKAKKVEAERRLERVQQNLLRLSDIVEEVESRLRSVRNQASRARRYREYSERLQQLRTFVGLTDWRNLTEQLEGAEQQLAQRRREADDAAAEIERLEARTLELEREILAAEESIRTREAQFARCREQITSREASVELQRTRCRELEQEIDRRRGQLAALSGRAGNVRQRVEDVTRSLADAERQFVETQSRLEQWEQRLERLDEELAGVRVALETRRQHYVECMRSAAQCEHQIGSLRSQLENAEQACRHLDERHAAARGELQTCQSEQAALAGQEQQLLEQLGQKAELLEAAERELSEYRRDVSRRQEDLAQLHGRLHGANERSDLLRELEHRREGIGAGVQQILAAVEQLGWARNVPGMVANLLQADVETAPLIDAALGERAQYLAVRGSQLQQHIEAGGLRLSGRVGLVPLEGLPPADPSAAAELVDLSDQPGVIGRADRLVDCEPSLRPLVQHLLGQTWLVNDLSTALQRQRAAGGAWRFVTAAGEVLEADGTVVLGPPDAAVGLISRRSELRRLEQQIEQMERRTLDSEREILRLQENIDQREATVRRTADEQFQLVDQLNEVRVRLRTLEGRREHFDAQLAATEAEQTTLTSRRAALQQSVSEASQRHAGLESELAALELAIREQEAQVRGLEQRRHEMSRQTTADRVEFARRQHQVEALQTQLAQFEEDRRERQRAIDEARAALAECHTRRIEAERAILDDTPQIAERYLEKDRLADQTTRQLADRAERVAERSANAECVQGVRRRFRKLEDQLHKLELAAGELRHQRATLVERLRDDYGIEIADLEMDSDAEQRQEREEIEAEIAELRRKLGSIGPVNMEALEELDDLETRFASLSSQYEDLAEAKQSLERIIQKINADSRRLFIETLEAIRQNFQALYRKAFGGGRADLVLEEGVDVLEAGVDIVATPPGKPSFNNSLLSGGEKALTAVSLLLAIFQFRPSPFCVLDEVDAPFDEANIGRFVDVLKEFLGWTKFVIVTHSKKTMTAATTLYGVTMQESGVSKRVSVRFEDVSDDGHINEAAVQRDQAADDDERGAA